MSDPTAQRAHEALEATAALPHQIAGSAGRTIALHPGTADERGGRCR